MDEILRKLNEFNWLYADKDPQALAILEERIAKASAHENRTITYSDLVRGVEFNLPDGSVYEICDFQNYGFDSRLIGDYLAYICKRSYERAGFMASAAVVMKEEGIPSPPFFGFMTKLGLLKSPNDDRATELWVKELDKAHQYYKSN
jgi:hypothetical protein